MAKSITEKNAKKFTAMILEDLQDEITAQLNGFVGSVVNDLSNMGQSSRTISATGGGLAQKGVSPVLTGFFASSWKAGTSQISRVDNRKGPWANIKFKGNKLLPGYKPLIKRRYALPKNLKLTDTVYIGNTTKYANSAIVSPKSNINAYLQGGAGNFTEGLNKKIDRFFTDKRPDIRVGAIARGSTQVGYAKQ